ncbi:MAG: A/G-specific adenine glycosylase [Pseudomonadota bacterium]
MTCAPSPGQAQDRLQALDARLLAWYDAHGRDLPWRAKGAGQADPYRVWLSEIMLQQTTIAAVIPYFQRFIARWPTVLALAAADEGQILQAWAGLGYYARARNLIACARYVAHDLGGRFPTTEEGLRALPGIGAYTAAAIAAIAFGQPAVVVDGNVERVMARLFAVADALPQARPRLKALAAELTPLQRAGDYAQAVMDLGATLCTPRQPRCPRCPWRARCRAHAAGKAEDYPRRAARKRRPTRQGLAFWLERQGHVLLVRRPAQGLLGGMLALPSSPWESGLDHKAALAHAPARAPWRAVPGEVRHVFTHFALDLTVVKARLAADLDIPGAWTAREKLLCAGLPSVMQKAVRHVLAAERGHARADR